MKNATMLYKCPGPHDIHGGKFDYTIVDEDDIAAAQADGWYLTTPEAKDAYQAAQDAEAAAAAAAKQAAEDAKEAEAEAQALAALADANKPPTRDELEQMATSLGLPFTARTSDKKLSDLIAAASEAPGA
ncbi:MAG: hypothetical protein HXX19_13055 [Rhodoferax sp.]|nr:hypothetical protein [Rhodoferax sp.]